jgi:benzoate/toluate 1,2-dioxygenase reductase component
MNTLKNTKLIKRSWLSKKAFQIQLVRPSNFEFIPGQNIRFIYGEIERYYSIISTPHEPTIELCIRFIKEGSFSSILATAEPGFEFKFTGPHGYFTFKPSKRHPVFVATGVGIAPFVSMVRSGITHFTLLHGAKDVKELYYESFFRKTASHFIACLSDSNAKDLDLPNVFHGRVIDFMRKELPRTEYDFYLCGRGEMVRDVTLLADEFFPGSLVYNEVFF